MKDPGASALNNSSLSGSTPGGSGAGLSLARRERFHQELNCFSDLTDILRDRDQHKFDYVLEVSRSPASSPYSYLYNRNCFSNQVAHKSSVLGGPFESAAYKCYFSWDA